MMKSMLFTVKVISHGSKLNIFNGLFRTTCFNTLKDASISIKIK